MAFAAVRARTNGSQNTDSTSHVIAMPGGATTGPDVLLCFFSCDGAPSTSTTSPGWSSLGSVAGGGASHTGSIWWKRATGTDALTLTTSSTQQSTHITISVRNAADPVATSDSSSPSPYVVFSKVYPPQGAADYLCFASVHTDSSATTSQSLTAPDLFINLQSKNPTTTQSAATFTSEREVSGVDYLWPP